MIEEKITTYLTGLSEIIPNFRWVLRPINLTAFLESNHFLILRSWLESYMEISNLISDFDVVFHPLHSQLMSS